MPRRQPISPERSFLASTERTSPAVREALARARNALIPHSSQQFAARHPQIGQREQGHELLGVLLQPSIADLGVAELPLDDPERMLDLGPDVSLDSLDPIDERAKQFAGVSRTGIA